MTDTLDSAPRGRSVPRIAWIAGAAAGVLAVGVTATIVLAGSDDGEKFPVVSLTPVEHEVTYEVLGAGTAPVITWIVGDRNAEQTALDVPLPWKVTVQIPVGPAGSQANVAVRSPGTGAGSLGCRMFLDGVLVNEKVSTDGFTGVACGAVIPPEYLK